MFRDMVFPKNNEAEFVEIAAKLSLKKIYFLYDFDQYNEEKIKKKLESITNNNINVEFGFIVNQKNIKSAIKQTKSIVAKSSENDRAFIESKNVRLIFGFEETHKKDYLHQRASGLNHIICEIANKNDVVLGFPYGSLLDKNNKEMSLLLGRMIQNINLCRKYKAKTAIGCFSSDPYKLRAPHDLMSLFGMLGMDAKTIKGALSIDL